MNAKSGDFSTAWVDPDDAPEITKELIDRGIWKIGNQTVARSEALAELIARSAVRFDVEGDAKISTTVRLDAEVVEAFRKSGDGWQAKMNEALREWLSTHQVV